MTALRFAIENVAMRQSREVGSDDLKALEALGRRIDEYLNTLGRE